MTTVDLVSPYEVRDLQFAPLQFRTRDTRWFIGVAHRRAGKTVADINELVIGARNAGLPNPRFAYVAPQLNQAKDIAWVYLKEYTAFLSAEDQ
jgi:phage terminase large subunit